MLKTVDLLGCLKDREKAAERFKEKHGKEADGYLFICNDCREENPEDEGIAQDIVDKTEEEAL